MSKFSKTVRKIHELSPDIQVTEERGCIVLRGEVDNWDTVVKAGQLAVNKKKYYGVINDIKLKGFHESMIIPSVKDNKLDGLTPDVLVIGAGIVGCSAARELSRYKGVDVLVVDKGSDVASGQSKANGGVIHVGINFGAHSQKHYYNALGNAMYASLAKQLDVPFEQKGQVMLDVEPWEQLIDKVVMWNGKKNLGIDAKYMKRPELLQHEPEVPEFFDGGMYMPIGGIVNPYAMTIAMAENAIHNGAKISLETAVLGIETEDGPNGKHITAVKTNRGTIYPKVVVNAAGIFTDKIAEMAGDRTFTIHPRRGTDIITDKKAGYLVKTSMAKAPFAVLPVDLEQIKGKPWKRIDLVKAALASHSKGVGLIHSTAGNMLVGPNATETPERENKMTHKDEFDSVMEHQMKLSPKLKYSDVIAYFTGVRAPTYEEDFQVRPGIFCDNIMEAAGVQSPGVTAAPAIAVDLAKWSVQYLQFHENRDIIQKADFDPVRKAVPRLKDMSPEERDEMIRKNPDYGIIVCRCEEVSKGEILDALNSGLCVPTVDGVKRRVRPGMGRCQGGFCSPLVMQILAEYLHVPLSEVRKDTPESVILFGDTKPEAGPEAKEAVANA